MTELGELALWMALLMTVWGSALSLAGARLERAPLAVSGRRGLYAAWGFVVLAAAALWNALLAGDFSLRYVATFTASNLAAPYRLSAFWAGASGSMLAWGLSLSTCLALSQVLARRAGGAVASWAGAAAGGVLAALLVVCVRLAPFTPLAAPAVDGRGLDPALQQPVAAVQPPLLYFGYMATLLGIILAGVAIARRRHAAAGWRAARAWFAAGWFLLLCGALAGLRRAYVARGAPGLADWHALPLSGAGNKFSVAAALVTAVAALGLAVLTAALRLEASGLVAAAPGGARRRLGRLLLAAGAVVAAAGLAGSGRARTVEVNLGDGESFMARDSFGRFWTLTSQGASRIERSNHFAVGVALLAAREGARKGFIAAEQREYVDAAERDQFPRLAVPGILTTALVDVYVALADAGGGRADLHIAFVPLVVWLWVGGLLAAAGGSIMTWPGRAREEAAP